MLYPVWMQIKARHAKWKLGYFGLSMNGGEEVCEPMDSEIEDEIILHFLFSLSDERLRTCLMY